MAIEFKVDTDRLTVDDLIAIEDGGNLRVAQLRDLLARFVYADGEFLEETTARKAVGKLTLAELKSAVKLFGDKVSDLKNAAINPTTGNVSS